MTTYLGKSCSFGLPRVPFVNCRPFMYVFSYFPFGFAGRMWDLIVSVPDHCLSFYFKVTRTDISQPYSIICYVIRCRSVWPTFYCPLGLSYILNTVSYFKLKFRMWMRISACYQLVSVFYMTVLNYWQSVSQAMLKFIKAYISYSI